MASKKSPKTPSPVASALVSLPLKAKIIAFLPFIAIVAAHMIWGANFLIAKITLQEFPPMTLGFLRFTMAILLLSPFLLTKQPDEKKVTRKDYPVFILAGILLVTLNIAFFYEGIKRTPITDASVITMSIPFLSVLAGWIYFREKIYILNLVGILFGIIGVFFILGVPLLSLQSSYTPDRLIGNVLILLASITWVAGAVVSKKILKKHAPLTLTTVIFLVGMVTFIIPAAIEFMRNPLWINNITVLGVLGLFYIAAASSVSAYFLFEWALGKLGVYKADLFQYLEPVIASILGILVLGEDVSPYFIIGAIFILLGAYWGTLAQNKHHKAHRH